MKRPVIKNYRSGYASNEGNGMVGGAWWGCEHLAHATVNISDHIDIPAYEDLGDRFDKVVDWLGNDDEVVVEAYIEIGEDKSTNCSTCEVDEVFYPDEFDERVNACPYLSDEEKVKTIREFDDFVSKMTASDFEFYDADEPDCED